MSIDRRTALGVLAVLAAAKGAAAHIPKEPGMYQLRIYQIFERNKAAFHDRFRDHAVRIMTRHSFDIVAMWEARGEAGPEFVYLLRWPDEAAMTQRWAGFMADEEWSRIKRETASRYGDLVGRIESRILQAVPYSSFK